MQTTVLDRFMASRFLCFLFWDWIYSMRAHAEELHLARTGPEYLTYMQSVPYRLIPKVY